MRYRLLIHQGTTPTPQTDEWESAALDRALALRGRGP